jgi:phosphate transport system substrate-binding protein
MERRTPNLFRIRAQQIREDGAWIDTGENDNALIRTLSDSPDALGVFGFSFLDQNRDKVRAVPIGGVEPSLETIRSKAYPVVRDLYLYVRSGAEPSTRDALAYAGEFTSGEASGPEGYLEEIGLIPLSGPDRRAVRDALRSVQDTDPS